jgi:hypothetical protein
VRAALLFLIAGLMTGWSQASEVPILRVAGLGRCSDSRDVILRVLPKGALTLNGEPQKPETLGQRLDAIYATRWSKHLFLAGDPKATLGDVLRVIRIVAKRVDYVVIVTPPVLKQAAYRDDGTCLAPNLPPGYPR